MKLRRLFRLAGPGAAAARLVARGDAANAGRRWAEAASAYQEALALEPDRQPIWVQFGHALKEQGFLARAEAAYRQAARLAPYDGDPHLQLGHVLRLQGEPVRAIAAYRAARQRMTGTSHGSDELTLLERQNPLTEPSPDLHLHERTEAAPADEDDVAVLLRTGRISTALLPLFDPYHYIQAHRVVREAGTPPTLAGCLAHFRSHGIALCLSVSDRDAFDAAFYRYSVLGDMPFTDENAYRHWLGVGLPGGAAPNRTRWLAALFGDDVPDLDAVDLAWLAGARDPQAGRLPWTLLAERFADDGADPRLGPAPSPANADILHAIATRLERESDQERMERSLLLRARLGLAVPEHRANARALAGALARETSGRRRDPFGAVTLYRRLCGLDREPLSSFVALAMCEETIGQDADSLATLRRGDAAWPGHASMADRIITLSDRLFGLEWDRAMASARLGRIADGQQRLRSACRLLAGDGSPAVVPSRPIRSVALVANLDLAQCRFYRVEQKIEQLETAGYDAELFDQREGLAAFLSAIHRFEAVIFYRVPALPRLIAAIRHARALGLVTIYEIDDLIFDSSAYPDPIETYADGLDRDEHHGLSLGVPLFAEAMRLCEHGIASTGALAEAMRAVLPGQVLVHRNGLGRMHTDWMARPPAVAGDRPVTILYGTGTRAHKQDFHELVEPALLDLAKRHGDRIAIVLVGAITLSDALLALGDRVTVIPALSDLASYWSLLEQADINIAMLKPGAAADAKSEIKWMEAAMLGIPSVVSDTATYRETVEDGRTGLVCRTQDDWTRALDRLVRDPGLRRSLGAAARAEVMDRYAPTRMADALRGLLTRLSPASDDRPVVLVVNVYYPPQAIGGATRVVHDNVVDLTRLYGDRYRIEVFTSIDGAMPHVLASHAQDGVRVIGCGPADVPQVDHLPEDPLMAERFGEVLDSLRPALVHVHCIQRLTVRIVEEAMARDIPYVISVHDGWWISDEQFLIDRFGHEQAYDYADPVGTLRRLGPRGLARMNRLRPALFGARRVLAVSDAFAAVYRRCGVPNVLAVPNGVSDLVVQPRLPPADHRVRLGFIGGLARHKGYDLLQIALRARPFANLRLLAIDHAMAPGESRSERWGSVQVDFEPKRLQRDVAGLYAEIDVLMAPSVWPESFGLVTREAVLCGCWVVASDRGGIGEPVIDGGNGYRIDVSTPDALIAVLERIDADPERFRRPPAQRPAIRTAREQADALAALYDECLAGPALMTETLT